MNVGTKSLLVGVHQFIWHPFTVFLAWNQLYGFPNWREIVCIFVHDWGYWGSPDMDGEAGELHPVRGALIASTLCDSVGDEYLYMVLFHSRHFAAAVGATPSKLCWADKLSVKFEPWWTYLPRAILAGEIDEYRKMAAISGNVPIWESNKTWYRWARSRFIKMGLAQNNAGVAYQKALEDR